MGTYKVIRNSERRYTKMGTRIGYVIIAIGLFLLAGHYFFTSDALDNSIKASAPVISIVPQTVFADQTMESKVEDLKKQVVADLAAKCETKGVKEPDAAIILDTNDRMSIGAWQFQITTVQHYIKVFEKREIDRIVAKRGLLIETQAQDADK